jgi:putative protease
MLYHEVPKNVNQLFAMVIDQKINERTYKVTSRNYFKLDDVFEVLAKKLNNIETVKLVSIKDENDLSLNVVNKPMSKLTIQMDKTLDLQPLDMIRIKR